jgi:hypothetical protein
MGRGRVRWGRVTSRLVPVRMSVSVCTVHVHVASRARDSGRYDSFLGLLS